MTTVVIMGGHNFGRVPPGTPHELQGAAWRLAIAQRKFFDATLNAIADEHGVTLAVHTGELGAGSLASTWAKRRGIAERRVGLDRTMPRRRAERSRNAAMLEPRPDLVVVFSGGEGTANLASQAIAAGIEVIDKRGLAAQLPKRERASA